MAIEVGALRANLHIVAAVLVVPTEIGVVESSAFGIGLRLEAGRNLVVGLPSCKDLVLVPSCKDLVLFVATACYDRLRNNQRTSGGRLTPAANMLSASKSISACVCHLPEAPMLPHILTVVGARLPHTPAEADTILVTGCYGVCYS